MNDLYKAIDSLKDIISEEESTVNEKIDLKTGYYTGTNTTPTKLQLDRLKKRGIVPQDYQLPKRVSKTNPSARPFIDFLNNLGNKVSKKGEKIFPKRIGKEPDVSQGSTIAKAPAAKDSDISQGSTISKTPMKKGKVKATAANTKNYDSTLALQKSLIAKGAKIDADGIMGPQTRAAMKQFGQPGATPIARPKTTPKSGGPDKRFITGPELDLPNKSTPPIRKLPKVIQPDNRFKDFDPRMPNQYVKNKDNEYALTKLPKQPEKKVGDDFINRIANSFGDIFKGSNKKVNADPLKLAQPKSDNTTKLANKNMIKRITGANT